MANQVQPDCRLERMRWDDVDEVHRIEKECFSSPWPKSVFRSMLSDHSAFAYVTRIDRAIAGYVISWLDSDQVVIANLAVSPPVRHRGLGKCMLHFAIGEGARSGASWAVLDVRESNVNAIRLYLEAGFQARGRRSRYYSNPEEDSLVMWKPLR